MGFLQGKRILITGVLSNRSIAYGIAQACHREGAELAFTYVGERFKDRITEFANEFGSNLVYECDVSDDAQIDAVFSQLRQVWPQLDGLVHAISFAPKEAIAGDFLEGLSREAFKTAHDISAYSFPALAKAAQPMLSERSALLTLTYLGAVKVVPNYNTMGLAKASLEASVRYLAGSMGPKGVRVNGIGPGTILTELAKQAVLSSPEARHTILSRTPLGRCGEPEEVAGIAAFLASDDATYMTGQTIYVDGGRMALNYTVPVKE